MKSILILLLTILAQVSFGSVKSFSCRNEARSAVTASLTMNQVAMNLKFGKGSDGGRTEDDIKNKSVHLNIDSEASANGYIEYSGDVLVSTIFADH